MIVQVSIDSKAILSRLEDLGESRQGPYVLSRTLNLLAKKVQDNLKQDFNTNFKLKRKAWVLNQIKIDKGTWATKKRLSVRIYLTDSADFIKDFETGADHVPLLGRKYLAIPNSKVFGKNAIIGTNSLLRIKNLAFRSTPFGVRGNQRTFIIKDKETGTPLILQRVANDAHRTFKKARSKDTGIRILYTLVKHSKRPKRITWYDTSRKTVANEQVGIWTTVIQEALANTRSR